MTRRAAMDHDVLGLGSDGSTWGNLGLWQHGEQRYERACAALAQHLGEAAQLQAGHHVLDVGFGCGDQLLLWRSAFGVARVTGRELVSAQVELARARVNSAGMHDVIRCEIGSATEDSSLDDGSVDRVLALDCAYHFRPRTAFLHEAHRVLKPGGIVAWTDLALPRALGSVGQSALELACAACEIPVDNMHERSALEAETTAAGFDRVDIRCIEELVFPGFAAFARRHRRDHLTGMPSGAWAKIVVTGLALEQIWQRRWLHYVVITAQRR